MSDPRDEPWSVPYLRGVPEPTAGPLWAGFGVTLLFATPVTHWIVGLVGLACAAAGFVAWARACFPDERLEPLAPGADQPLPPPVLHAAERHTRVMLPATMHPYRAGLRGGLVGGAAMAVVASAWGLLKHGSAWLPINLLAGVFTPSVGERSLEALQGFDAGLFAIACGIHLVTCLFVGLLYTVTLPMMPSRPLLMGGVLGPLLWTGLLYASIGIVNPALERFISWPWFFASQVAFGLACGLVVSRARRIDTMTGMPLEERMGVERGGSR